MEVKMTINELKDEIGTRKVLFVIPCCKHKKMKDSALPEGVTPAAGIHSHLDASTDRDFISARRKVLPLARSVSPGFLQAFDRYDGTLYSVPGVRDLLVRHSPHTIYIMSALYGLLATSDWIRNYELKMNAKDVTPSWRSILPAAIVQCSVSLGVDVIVGLFGETTAYAKVFKSLGAKAGCDVYAVHTNAGRSQKRISQGLGHGLLFLAAGMPVPGSFIYSIKKVR